MGADILTKPWKVSPRNECLYAYAPGEVCVDLTSGKPEDRARVLALLGQVQAAFSLLHSLLRGQQQGYRMTPAEAQAIERVLREAGLMSEGFVESEGT